MIDLPDILLGGVLPGLVACIILSVVARATNNHASAWRIASATAFLVGLWALDARGAGFVPAIAKSLRIQEAKDFLPLAVLIAIVPDMVASYGGRSRSLAWGLRIALCVGLPWRLLYGSIYLPRLGAEPNPFNTSAWSTMAAILWLGSIGALLTGVWMTWRLADGKNQPFLRTLLVAVVFLAGALTLTLSGSLTFGQLSGVLTATAAGCLLAQWLGQLDRGPDAASGPLILAFGGVLTLACFYAELKVHNAALLLLALAVAGGWCLPNIRRSGVVRSAVCLLLLGIAVTGAAVDFSATQAEKADNPYSQFME